MDLATPTRAPAATAVQEVLKCKWALLLLGLVRAGTTRPAHLQRAATGISYKVMSERLAKLVRLGLLERSEVPEARAHVEYALTAYGKRVADILDRIAALDDGR
jgi:DNA-binding HxlR family transcriptional regulator